jgi:hypothetical protein
MPHAGWRKNLAHNHTILHARSAYEDWPEVERKRHLLRLWLSPPGARPLPPVFAECYGSLTIGDRGGIICKGALLHVPLTLWPINASGNFSQHTS